MLTILSALPNGACDYIVDQVDVGTGTAQLQLWSGPKPDALDLPEGTLLAAIDLPDPAFGDAGAVVLPGWAALNDLPLSVDGLASGTVGFVRVLNKDGDPLWDEDEVSTEPGSPVVVNTLDVTEGFAVKVEQYFFKVA